MKRYEIIDHTADVGIQTFGRTCEELFANAAYALFDLMTDLQRVGNKLSCRVQTEGIDREDLLVRWLSELLFLNATQGYLFKDFSFSIFQPTALEATAYGEIFDPIRHEWKTEIKAVTYHQVTVQEKDGQWEGKVIFDV